MKRLLAFFVVFFWAGLLSAQPVIKTRVTTPFNDSSQSKLAPATSPRAGKAAAPKAKADKTKLDRFRVQVGAFSSEENAQRLKERLKKAGFAAKMHISKDLDRRVWYHVLIGDYKTQKKAERRAERYMLSYNMKAVVLDYDKTLRVFKPEADLALGDKPPKVYGPPGVKDPELIEPPDTIFTPTVPPKQKFTFQVGGLYKLNHARALARNLKKRGYKPIVAKRRDVNNIEWWYTVEIGYFYTKTEAEYAASAFFDKENIQAVVPTP